MPTVLIEGYEFRFYSSDGNEPPHVHVLRDDNEAKIWLVPVALQHNHGYSASELDRIFAIDAPEPGAPVGGVECLLQLILLLKKLAQRVCVSPARNCA